MALTKLELTPLDSAPRGAHTTTDAWKYLRATHQSVDGLFDALHVVRSAKRTSENRGTLSADQQDLLRAALVFTSSGLDACLTKLLHDTLGTLIATNRSAEKEFKTWVSGQLNGRASGKIGGDLQKAILDENPREQLVALYVAARTAPSLQATKDLRTVRDALGLTTEHISDDLLDGLAPFLTARNEIAHELDLVVPTGPGTSTRRERNMDLVRSQCDEVLTVAAAIIRQTVRAVRRGAPGR